MKLIAVMFNMNTIDTSLLRLNTYHYWIVAGQALSGVVRGSADGGKNAVECKNLLGGTSQSRTWNKLQC